MLVIDDLWWLWWPLSVFVPAPHLHIAPQIRLLRELGAGGMGSVWVARHESLRTDVAVKFLNLDLAHHPSIVERFSREAAAAANVKSPHVVQVFDHGTVDGTPFIVMELLDGRDLAARIDEGAPLPLSEVAAIVEQVCKALGRAHERGIVHRDIKPANVFLCNDGDGEIFVKLLDFGIAKAANSGMSATRTGLAIGTPYYMSPEQAIGAKTIDHRTDLWSLGVLAFECLTGRRPFEGETDGALTLAIHHGPIPSPSQFNRALPGAVDAWFLRACARKPEERFESAKRMLESLRAAAVEAPNHRPLPVAPTLQATAPLADYRGSTAPAVTELASASTTVAEPVGVSGTAGATATSGTAKIGIAVAAVALLGVGLSWSYTRARGSGGEAMGRDATTAASLASVSVVAASAPPAPLHEDPSQSSPGPAMPDVVDASRDAPAADVKPPATPVARNAVSAQPSRPRAEAVSGDTPSDAPFDKAAAIASLSAAAASASNCKTPDGPTGTGKVSITFMPSGRATNTQVSGDLAGTPVGGCVARVFRATRVPAFAGDAVTVSKSFVVQ